MRIHRSPAWGRTLLWRRTVLALIICCCWSSSSCGFLGADGTAAGASRAGGGGVSSDEASEWSRLLSALPLSKSLASAAVAWDPSGLSASRVLPEAVRADERRNRPELTPRDYLERMMEDRREAWASAAAAAESADSTPHQEGQGPEDRDRNRNLIYNGKPTGGKKYPFLVSMWVSDSAGSLLSPPFCHGVMVTDDVFITSVGCLNALAFSPVVAVGDYDSSAPLDESVQLRDVISRVLIQGFVGLGLLNKPVTFDGFAPVAMSSEAAPPEAGENLTFVGYSGDLVPLGYSVARNATVWPGPALETPMQAVNNNLCALLTGTDGSLLLCAIPSNFADPAFPCADDLGGPVLDGSNKLLGYTWFTECGYGDAPMALVVRSSFIKSAVEAIACRMIRREDPPFSCSDFNCPLGIEQLGYPFIELNDYRPYVTVRNGYEPVSLVQFPPPGAVVRYGTTVNYSITGTDSSNRTRSCSAFVKVPPLAQCGTALVNVTTVGGASTVRVPITPSPGRRNFFATVHQMKGRLERILGGRNSTATARLLQGGVPHLGSITFRGNRTKGTLNQLRVPANSSYLNASGILEVDFQVKDVVGVESIVARFDVYCQSYS